MQLNRNSQRPSSQRSHRRFQTTFAATSFARLQKLQKLLEETKTDGLLCVQGIDSRYNEGTHECLNYLLFGQYSNLQRQDPLSAENDDDEVMDDLIICVKPNAVDVYCNPLNYQFMLPCIASWPNLHIHCLSQTQYDSDDEGAEEFKIRCFVSMVSSCKHIAVPYFSHNRVSHQRFDKMKVEQWPIIQAYALEGYGSGTFFTLQHDVMDVSSALSVLYEKFDAVSTESFVLEQLPVFERQWDGLSKTLDVARMAGSMDTFTETIAAEPLVTYFNHGRVSSDSEPSDTSPSLWQKPFVCMGTQTKNICREITEPCAAASINTAGVGGARALHMVCHGVAPRSGLACTRTYFFDSSSLPPIIGSDQEYRNVDTEQLSRAYRTAIEVTLKSVNDYAACLQPNQVIENIKKNVVNGLQKFVDCRKLEIIAKLEWRLSDGRHGGVKEGVTPQSMITISVVIGNIISARNQKVNLGAVAYTDTFLISSVKYVPGDGGQDFLSNTETVNLTQNVPRWMSWNISDGCADMLAATTSLLSNENSNSLSLLCGQQLIDGQNVEIVSPQVWLQPIPCTLYLHSQAVILVNNTVGPITLSKDDIKSVHFYDGGGPSAPAFVTLYTSMDFQTKLPTQLTNSMRMLVISLNPRTKAYKQFFEQVFEAWKEEGGGFSLTMEETLPDSLSVVHTKVAAKFKMEVSRPLSKLPSRNIAIEDSWMVVLQRFINHITVSSSVTPSETISYDDVCTLLNQSEDVELKLGEGNSSGVMLTISIISGVPGSYKENVANFITQLTQERSRWVIHKQTPETSHYFDAVKLENSLSYVYSVLKKKSNAGAKSSRMLVITPGYTDIQTVVSVIQNHPNMELRHHIKIGAVSTCVDPHNTFISGHYTMPGLLNQCAHGWVNNVVLTSSSDQDGNLSQVQSLIRAANPAVNFIITDRGELTRSQDIELILSESSFNMSKNTRSRLLLRSEFKSSAEAYGMNTIMLNFSQPLIKQKFTSKLRELHASRPLDSLNGMALHVSGRLRFTGSEEMFDVNFAPISNALKITPAQLKQGDTPSRSFLSVTGISLLKSLYQGLLRECVPPKPEKKEYLTMRSLDRVIKDTIHKDKHLEPLPPGWFYNGTQYVDMSGTKTDRHPEFDNFLQEYIDRENISIREYNENIDKMDYHDLFE